MKHRHSWTPINHYLKQCRCGEIRTTGKVFGVPRVVHPKMSRSNLPLGVGPTITSQGITDTYGVSKNIPANLHHRGLINRISRGIYCRMSVEAYFRFRCVESF